MPWYVVRTKPQHEIKSAKFLENLGLEVYCPVVTEVRQWSDRKKKVTVPLFKSYLFVKPEDKERSVVYEAPGVLNYLYWLNKPAQVREEEIKTLKDWLEDDRVDEFKVEKLVVGDTILLSHGPLKDKEAKIRKIGKKRMWLLLPALDCKVNVRIADVI